MTDSIRACTTCLLCLREDYGISNVTVDGTALVCLAGLNPALEGEEEVAWPFTMSPALAAALDVALSCARYRFGAPATLDVEWHLTPDLSPPSPESLLKAGYTDDPEAAALLASHLA